MYGDNRYIPPHQGGKVVTYRQQTNRRNNAAITKLTESITNLDSNVLDLAAGLVNNASPAVRARLMDLVVAIIHVQCDAYEIQGDMSEGPTTAMRLRDMLNSYGIQIRP